MPDANLIKYIRDGLAMGRTEDVLRPLLLRAGWQEKDINEAFQAVKSGTAPTAATTATTTPAASSTPATSQPAAPAQPATQPAAAQTQSQPQPHLQQPQSPTQIRATAESEGHAEYQSQSQQPQQQVQPQSQPQQKNYTMASTPAAGVGNKGWMVVALAIIVIVGGGGWVAYAMFGAPPSAQSVLDSVFQKGFAQTKSFDDHMILSADVMWTPASTEPGPAALAIVGGPAEYSGSVEASGTMAADPNGGEDTDQMITINVNVSSTGQEEKFSGSAEIRIASDTIYIDITSLPNLGFINPSTVVNKWFSIPISTSTADFAESYAGLQAPGVPSTTFSGADRQAIFTAAEGVIDITKTLSASSVDGVPTYHYAYTLDEKGVEHLINTIVGIEAKELPSSEAAFAASTTADINTNVSEFFKDVSSMGGELWVGESDRYLHQATFSFASATSSSYGTTAEKMGVTSTITDINGNQSIEVPPGAEDLQTYFDSLYGQ